MKKIGNNKNKFMYLYFGEHEVIACIQSTYIRHGNDENLCGLNLLLFVIF